MDTSQIALNQSLTFLSWTVGIVVFVVGVFLTKLIIDLSILSKSLLQTSKILNEELKPTIEELKQTLTNKVCDVEPENLEFVTNSRQQNCLTKARASLDQALLAANFNELQDLISIDVKASLLALDELTGELITDDILDNIFDHFCIGK